MFPFNTFMRLYFAPDEAGGVSVPTATPADSAPAGGDQAGGGANTPPAASTTPSAPSAQAATTPGAASPTSAATTPTQPSWLQGLRDSGIDLGSDEKAAMQQLTQTLRQYQQLAPYIQSYQQHAGAFGRYLQDQQKTQQHPAAQQAQPPSWKQQYWNPPEFNQSWLQLLRKDEQGNLQVVPGAPPDILPKYQAYQQYRQEFADKFMSDPISTFEPIIKQLVTEQAQQLVEQRMSQQRDQQSSQQFVQENTTWLYERDANGNVQQQQIFNPMTGQCTMAPQLSPWGQRFSQYVQQEASEQQRRGFMDVGRQQQVAMAMIQRDYAFAQLQGQRAPAPAATPPAPQNPREAANQRLLQQNNPPANVPPTNGNANPGPQRIPKGQLRAELLKAFSANGINDQTLNNNP